MNIPMFLLLLTLGFDRTLSDTEFSDQKSEKVTLYNRYEPWITNTLHTKTPLCYHLWYMLYPGPVYNPMKFLKLNVLLYPGSKTNTKKYFGNSGTEKLTTTKKDTSESTITGVASTTSSTSSTSTTTVRSTTLTKKDDIDFINYHSLDQIYKYLNKLPWKYPHLTNVEAIGKSSEGRDIKLVKVSTGDVGVKAVILIVGGMQGNNWLTSATVLYAIQQLVENPVNNYMLGKADWYLLPVANPDGYEYSRNINQSWIKTRSTDFYTAGCTGVNLNKNFDYKCHLSGSYDNSCSDSFAGRKAFSVNESKALENFITTNKVNIQLYIHIDDFGQSIEFPINQIKFGNDTSDLKFIADQVSYAIAKYGGHEYAVKGLDKSDSCGSEQWVRRLGIKYSYKIKLPSDNGRKSETLASEILPIVQEIFVVFRELQRTAVTIYGVTYDLITDD